MGETDPGGNRSGAGTGYDDGGESDSTSGLWSLLSDNKDVLQDFLKQPTSFVLGSILSIILGGVEAMVESLLDAIWFVFVGDEAGSTEGAMGLEDIPLTAANLIVGAGETLGMPVLEITDTVFSTIADIALLAGPFAPFVLTIGAALAVAVYFVLLRTLIRVVLDVIPGLGGLLS
jgi:hypothetical protein